MLISARRLAGAPLTGTDGRRLGTIREVIIDRHRGQVVYALMAPEDDRASTPPRST